MQKIVNLSIKKTGLKLTWHTSMQIDHSYYIYHNFSIVQSCNQKYSHSFTILHVLKIACIKSSLFISLSPSNIYVFTINFFNT